MNRVQLSHNFYLDEFTRSQTAVRHGIDMTIDDEQIIINLEHLCQTILQPVRDALGSVHITSGYRPPALNKRIGGSPTSDHCFGLAADFVVSGATPLEVSRFINSQFSKYKQLIHEFGEWTHVSIPYLDEMPRQQSLTAVKVPWGILRKPKTLYVAGIIPIETAKEHING